ncbi:hypothetical protein C8J56DRAFT_901635 [Mycena floridula]|nr:hypothetical protein C8J56DRAFT_901635 [Mycena floridula]
MAFVKSLLIDMTVTTGAGPPCDTQAGYSLSLTQLSASVCQCMALPGWKYPSLIKIKLVVLLARHAVATKRRLDVLLQHPVMTSLYGNAGFKLLKGELPFLYNLFMPPIFMLGAAVQSFIIASSMFRALASIAFLLGQEVSVDRMTSVLAILTCSLGFWLRCYDDPEHFWSYLLSFWVPALVAAPLSEF